MSEKLLEIEDLSIHFHTASGEKALVQNISLNIDKGEMVALVGASGSGKSISALSILRLLPQKIAYHPSGKIWFQGENLLEKDDEHFRLFCGSAIGMVFQEPMTSLNPLHGVIRQIDEMIAIHNDWDASKRAKIIDELLFDLGLDFLRDRHNVWPHQLSGGQKQRVMIAIALANNPSLLIADEPTTALDVTVQAQILNLLQKECAKRKMALLLISHDLDIVAKMAHRVYVMADGKIIENGLTNQVFSQPQHPMTRLLLEKEPSGKKPQHHTTLDKPLLSARDLKIWFPIKKRRFSQNNRLCQSGGWRVFQVKSWQ